MIKCLFSGALLAFIFLPANSLPAKEKPNVIIIYTDDMGYADPSCFGNPKMRTPNIDRLADEGMSLKSFYSNSPVCSPSRVALNTGCYPARSKILDFLDNRASNKARNMPDFLDPATLTLAKVLRHNGYKTGHFGKWHMGGGRDVKAPHPKEYGFDESYVSFEGMGNRLLISDDPYNLSGMSAKLGGGKIDWATKAESSGIFIDKAIGFIERNKSGPFYINLCPHDMHDPHLPSQGNWNNFKRYSENEFWQKYFAVLDNYDRQLGRFFDWLDQNGLKENTIVIFTSDNGPTDLGHYYRTKTDPTPPGYAGPFRGRKFSLHEGGIRMPFIIRYPGRIKPGATNENDIVLASDLMPSIITLTGSSYPEMDADGEDRSEIFFGKSGARKSPAFWVCGKPYSHIGGYHPSNKSPALAVRDGKWKFLMDSDGSHAMLFDMDADPAETVNLNDVTHSKIVTEMKEKLNSWQHEMRLLPPKNYDN